MSQIELIAPREHDLGGGLVVRRLLPSGAAAGRRPVPSSITSGPVAAGPDDDHDVRPHPHIGLATLTYLFEGTMVHRDSTGAVQRIEPGEISWMTAGRGVEHSGTHARRTARAHGGAPTACAVLGRAAGSAPRPTILRITSASAVAELILAVRRCAYWSAPGSARRRRYARCRRRFVVDRR